MGRGSWWVGMKVGSSGVCSLVWLTVAAVRVGNELAMSVGTAEVVCMWGRGDSLGTSTAAAMLCNLV